MYQELAMKAEKVFVDLYVLLLLLLTATATAAAYFHIHIPRYLETQICISCMRYSQLTWTKPSSICRMQIDTCMCRNSIRMLFVEVLLKCMPYVNGYFYVS